MASISLVGPLDSKPLISCLSNKDSNSGVRSSLVNPLTILPSLLESLSTGFNLVSSSKRFLATAAILSFSLSS